MNTRSPGGVLPGVFITRAASNVEQVNVGGASARRPALGFFTGQPVGARRRLPHWFSPHRIASSFVQHGVLAATLLVTTDSPAAQHYEASGTQAVETIKYDWKDSKRDREVPVKIYHPKTGSGPFPVIIFSHGLGGTRDAYEYLGRHWASHGYMSVHLQHLGSDDDVWRNAEPGERMQAMRRSAMNPQNSLNRPLDVSFAIDQMAKLHREAGPFKGRLDFDRVGAAGHSFGAYTTLAVAGQVFVGPFVDGKTLGDPRIKAAIPMSAPVPPQKDKLDRVYGSIRVPCLHMTGTKDNSPIGNTPAEDRRLPFDHSNGADQYLIIFKDGDHMIFSGRGPLPGGQQDKTFQALICESTLAFWDAYLKGDPKAKAWLAGGSFESALGKDGTFEKKLKTRS